MTHLPRLCFAPIAVAVLLLAACSPMQTSPISNGTGTATGTKASAPDTWVLLGPDGQSTLRTAQPAGTPCPAVDVDGQRLPMSLRIAAHTAPDRAPEGSSAQSATTAAKRADFPIDVCELRLPSGARSASVGSQHVPLYAKVARRVVVLGDTGCRIKGDAAQNCNDPTDWPFAQVATAAAALKPDLVIHVGDYHYRESPCPAGQSGCAGSPWGYGWDAWRADFFAPAAPLLRAAPWVFVRGNHEECNRAGQGWARLLAPEPLTSQRSCDRAADDEHGDVSAPYTVPLGPQDQLIVFDSARAGNKPLEPGNPRDALLLSRYEAQVRELTRWAGTAGMTSWFTSHHQVLGFAPHGQQAPFPGNPALLTALRSENGGALYPRSVQLTLHGHVHLFQAIGFDSPHPATLVAGHGGDSVDDELPQPLPPGTTPAEGAHIADITHSSAFGFLLLERENATDHDWTVTAYRTNGSVLSHCRLGADRSLRCDPSGRLR